LRIGVDIDGVLADSLPLWTKELNSYFGKNKKVEDLHLYDICQTYGINQRQLDEFIRLKGRYLMTAPPPVKGSTQFLPKIKEKHEIFIITARNKKYEGETVSWLKKCGIPFDELILLGSHDKREACVCNGVGVMIEDTLEVSVKVTAGGVPVLLLDAPYNRGALPEKVLRVRSWEEIYRAISAGTLAAEKEGGIPPALDKRILPAGRAVVQF